jgi:hypothetical protein
MCYFGIRVVKEGEEEKNGFDMRAVRRTICLSVESTFEHLPTVFSLTSTQDKWDYKNLTINTLT